MATENLALMKKGRESLKGNWGLAIGAFLVVYLIEGAIQSIHKGSGGILILIIGGPFALGMAMFSLSYSRHLEPRFEQIFEGFRDFTRALVTYLLVVLYVFLWMLLLIVPGIIAALSYSMTFFILADDPSIKAADALKKEQTDDERLQMETVQIVFAVFRLGAALHFNTGYWLFVAGAVDVYYHCSFL